MRMWNPASRVLLYFPSRSTMYALCCGTTMAVRMNSTKRKMTKTRATIHILSAPLFLFDDETETVHFRDPETGAFGRGVGTRVVRAPGGATQLDFSPAVGREVLEREGDFTHELIDLRRTGLELP